MAKVKKNIEPDGFLDSHISRIDAAYANLYKAADPFESTNLSYARSSRGTKERPVSHTPVDDMNRLFIKLDRKFRGQLAKEREAFSGCSDYLLNEKMRISAELLLSGVPDAISLELTNEGSIFYTWRKNDISIYLDHYLIDEYDGKDEMIVSIYKNNDKLADFAGSMDEAIVHINNTLASESIVFPVFA